MQLLFYASRDDENGRRLLAAVRRALPLLSLGVFRELSALQGALRTIVEPGSIAVLSAVDRAELRRLQGVRGLLTEIFVVLVIPDYNKGTMRMAHRMLPRFINRQEESFAELAEVLRKMASTAH